MAVSCRYSVHDWFLHGVGDSNFNSKGKGDKRYLSAGLEATLLFIVSFVISWLMADQLDEPPIEKAGVFMFLMLVMIAASFVFVYGILHAPIR